MEKILIRVPRIEDLDSMLEMVNSLVDERAMISVQEKQTRVSERKFLKYTIAENKNNKSLTKILVINNKVMGICSVVPYGYIQSHVGEMGIFLKKEARGRGLGKKLFLEVINEGAKMFGLKILRLLVFAKNKPAISLYKSVGFKKIGTIKGGANYYGAYEDDNIMVRYL